MSLPTSTAAVVCTPGALTPDEHRRLLPLSHRLFGRVEEVRDLENGYALRLPQDHEVFTELGEFLSYNRRCCTHLRHALVVEAQLGPVWLELTGPEGTRESLAPELAGLLPERAALASIRASEEAAEAVRQRAQEVIARSNLPLDVATALTSHIRANR